MLLILKSIIELLKNRLYSINIMRVIIITDKKATQKIDEIYGKKKLTKYV